MKAQIGAPSLTGTTSGESLAGHFAQAAYPMKLLVVNHMPRNFRHSALKLDLHNCAAGPGNQAVVVVTGFEQLQKLCTEAEALAELNHYETAIEVCDLDALAAADNAPVAGATTAPPVPNAPVAVEEAAAITAKTKKGGI